MTDDLFQSWLERWSLVPDGGAITSEIGNHLLPVRRADQRAMLKIAVHEEERRGTETLAWYRGQGAVRVLERQDEAVLMDRLDGPLSLADMARGDQDDEATAILCATAQALHRPRRNLPSSLVPLDIWFKPLFVIAAREGSAFARSAAMAAELLANPTSRVVLHGDLHHDNVLDGGARGWLAIDPKGLLGEAGYDYANLLHNPDRGAWQIPGRFAHRVGTVASETGQSPRRLLEWALAYYGLAAAWRIEDGGAPTTGLAVAALAAAELES